MDKNQVAEKASETVTLNRSQLWMLQISAATGVMSLISHGIGFLHYIGVF